MKATLIRFAATLLIFNYMHGSAALADFPPNMADPAARQTYIKTFSEKIKNAPNDYESYVSRAYIYLHDDKLQESLADLNKANELQTNNLYVLSMRGELFLALRDYKSAILDESAAIALKPQEAGLYSNRGLAFMLSGKLIEAQKDASRALQ